MLQINYIRIFIHKPAHLIAVVVVGVGVSSVAIATQSAHLTSYLMVDRRKGERKNVMRNFLIFADDPITQSSRFQRKACLIAQVQCGECSAPHRVTIWLAFVV